MKTHASAARVASVAVAALVVLTGCSALGMAGSKTVTRKLEITRPVTVSADDRTVGVMAESGGCDGIPWLRVSETAEAVVLTVRVTARTGPDVVCAAVARVGPVRATLRAVLGARILIDGTTGRRLAGAEPAPRREHTLKRTVVK